MNDRTALATQEDFGGTGRTMAVVETASTAIAAQSKAMVESRYIMAMRNPVQVVGIRREALCKMTDDIDYGLAECALEGFADHPSYRWPSEFVSMFCASHKGCIPETIITRIEFEYTQENGNG